MFQKFAALVLAAFGLFAFSPVQAATDQTGNVPLPILESSYQPNFVGSLVMGTLSPTDGDSGSLIGAELSLDCPIFQPSTGLIRQQVSYATYSQNSVTVSLIELNPHWVTEVSTGFFVGGGPGLGLATASVTGGSSKSYFEIGLGASAFYKMDSLQFGGEWRQMSAGDLNNSRMLLKAGLAF